MTDAGGSALLVALPEGDAEKATELLEGGVGVTVAEGEGVALTVGVSLTLSLTLQVADPETLVLGVSLCASDADNQHKHRAARISNTDSVRRCTRAPTKHDAIIYDFRSFPSASATQCHR